MKTKNDKKKFRWVLFLNGACLLLISFWFNFATIDYNASETSFPFSGSGWFFLSLMFTIPTASLFAILFCFIAKKSDKLAWVLMLTVSSLLIFYAVKNAMPKNQLSMIIGQEAVEKVKIEKLYIGDSFNDGIFAYGILLDGKELISLIKKYRQIELKKITELEFHNRFLYFKKYKFPAEGYIFLDDYGSFYLSPKDNRLYFSWHSRSH